MSVLAIGWLFVLCHVPLVWLVRTEQLLGHGGARHLLRARRAWLPVVLQFVFQFALVALLVEHLQGEGPGRVAALVAFGISELALLAGLVLWLRIHIARSWLESGQRASRAQLSGALRANLLLFFGPVALTVIGYVVLRRVDVLGRDEAVALLVALVANLAALVLFYPRLLALAWPTAPLKDCELARELETLARRAGTRIAAVREIDFQGFPVANAWITGLAPGGRTVFLSRTLVEKLRRHELRAIFAHELGHARLGHLWLYATVALVQLAVLFGLRRAIPLDWPLARAVSTLVFVLVLAPLMFHPIIRRCELAADRYSARLLGNSEDLASALQRIEQINAAPAPQGPLGRLLRTHPLLDRRLAHLRAAGVQSGHT